ncbi:bifunctional phosphoribosylaminoimidazolecarboxamide formyltransferase/IMP cyclohydrolase [Legionella fairfieldensis]|uniref:bifunctional phosphoribosylaminoimidazolecarboxamide formyltransferase/IMP cyclohydrolase n=1 Tax=Legionella fairfieldensis TaxID=45064 RepID=UPI00048C9FCC|nr:bifunctional phosphoribosylaminoimidazolecarboxamide formyltransferase/IMP cyclohydrolase [Legionella fairfieldensis]
MKTAFISVSNKEGLVEVARVLINLDIRLIASKGTAAFLSENKIEVLSIEDYLNCSPLLDGRVKTLHPALFSGILADRKNVKHRQELQQINVEPIDFVIIDLYAFSQYQDMEHIDIGGVALIRAAAKNYEYCTVVSDANDYPLLIKGLESLGVETNLEFRKKMAARAFSKIAQYDGEISQWCDGENIKSLQLQKTIDLSYGENPHQAANFYNWRDTCPNITLLQGKPLSYNNLLDLDAGIRLISEFDTPAATIIKHTNPCGVALAQSAKQAVQSAFHADEKSAFGGIVVLNQVVDKETALFLKSHFFEVIAAVDYTSDAREILGEKAKCRILIFMKQHPAMEMRSVLNGFLMQRSDANFLEIEKAAVPTLKKPDAALYSDLCFAFQVVRHMKSNAIVIVKNGITLSMGVGQTNRVDAVHHALQRVKNYDLQDAVLASDGFFPFEDSIELIAQTSIKTILQPGGSRRDHAIIETCNKYQISMMMTGIRGFRH